MRPPGLKHLTASRVEAWWSVSFSYISQGALGGEEDNYTMYKSHMDEIKLAIEWRKTIIDVPKLKSAIGCGTLEEIG